MEPRFQGQVHVVVDCTQSPWSHIETQPVSYSCLLLGLYNMVMSLFLLQVSVQMMKMMMTFTSAKSADRYSKRLKRTLSTKSNMTSSKWHTAVLRATGGWFFPPWKRSLWKSQWLLNREKAMVHRQTPLSGHANVMCSFGFFLSLSLYLKIYIILYCILTYI